MIQGEDKTLVREGGRHAGQLGEGRKSGKLKLRSREGGKKRHGGEVWRSKAEWEK